MMLNLLHKLEVVNEVGIDVIMKSTRPRLVASGGSKGGRPPPLSPDGVPIFFFFFN